MLFIFLGAIYICCLIPFAVLHRNELISPSGDQPSTVSPMFRPFAHLPVFIQPVCERRIV